MRVENLKKQESVVESVLFTMGQSVEIRQLAAALESDEETAIQAVERLKEKYDKRKAGMQIVRLDDSYQMCSRTDYYEHLIRVAATPKKQVLSDVVMDAGDHRLQAAGDEGRYREDPGSKVGSRGEPPCGV
jgi:segregation and condensation protein B